jgi:hypothetical protein
MRETLLIYFLFHAFWDIGKKMNCPVSGRKEQSYKPENRRILTLRFLQSAVTIPALHFLPSKFS